MPFASLWDCFLLFCAHKENWKRKKTKKLWVFGGCCQSIFTQKTKVKIIMRWHLADALYKPSFTKLND